jgi:IclR family transcriptional regulator, KDG regulon repressor
MVKSTGIRVVALALDAMELLCKQTGGLGVRELARELTVGKSTAHRILQTLTEYGVARQDPETERYIITARLVNMAAMIHRDLEFRRVARPFLSALQERCDETIFIGVLDSAEVVIVDRLDSSEALRMTHEIGYREPAHSTALGKVLLASLPEQELAAFCESNDLRCFTNKTVTSPQLLTSELKRVRLLGFAVDDEETLTGVRCVAAPLRDALGRVVAAISLTGPSVRLTDERISRLAQDIRTTADSISAELGFTERGGSLEVGATKYRSGTNQKLQSGRSAKTRFRGRRQQAPEGLEQAPK